MRGVGVKVPVATAAGAGLGLKQPVLPTIANARPGWSTKLEDWRI